MKQLLDKCRSRVYSDLIRSNFPDSSGVSPSGFSRSRSPPLPAMETSPGGPFIVKPTRGELRARVKLLVKKKRSIKRRAQDPPEGSLPARGKVPKLGVSDPCSRTQVQVRGQVWSSSAKVFEVAGAQCHLSLIVRVKGSSRKVVELPLKVLTIFV